MRANQQRAQLRPGSRQFQDQIHTCTLPFIKVMLCNWAVQGECVLDQIARTQQAQPVPMQMAWLRNGGQVSLETLEEPLPRRNG